MDSICPYTGQDQDRIAQILRIRFDQVPVLAQKYCANVGKRAYNAVGPDSVRNTDLGPITAVIWVIAGDVLSSPGEPMRLAPISGFMYVIGPGGVSDHEFQRWVSDIYGK